MARFEFDRKRMDELVAEFREVATSDPIGIDPADDTTAEFGYLCHAVKHAGRRFRLLSLGAAPGEWAMRAERLYRSVQPHGDYHSLSLEGDAGHVAIIEEFWRKHSVDLHNNLLRYAVVSPQNGWAYFPKIASGKDWGAGVASFASHTADLDAHISMTDSTRDDRTAANGGKPLEFATVQAFGLSSLLSEIGSVNYIHCDIQGHEADVFCTNMPALDKEAMMVCIETHGHQIQDRLLESFAKHSWELEGGWTTQPDGRDGTYIWSNPRF